jgi:uncharacterized protein
MSNTISMYQASVPVFIHTLQNLAHILRKGEAHARDKNVAPEVLLQTRLIPDMLPLVRQVQIACDMAKNGSSRLAGIEPPKIADDETDFDQLHARIQRTIDYVRGIDAAQIDGSEGRRVSFSVASGGEMTFTGQDYLLGFVLPNLYFHVTTTYALLRQAGAALGKTDFHGVGAER